MKITCKICQKNRAKRHCPGVDGDICATCCATEREVTVDCPSSCDFLREARLHDPKVQLTAEQVPNREIEVSEDFVRKQEHLVLWVGNALTRAMASGKAVDSDAREAIQAMIQSYRAADSGLLYEAQSTNPYVVALSDALKTAVEQWGKQSAENAEANAVKDSDIIGVLIFLQRLELQYANGRRRGRAFFDFLTEHFPEQPTESVVV
ncbi:MAG: hypothetical protein ABI995_15430 [Acidobacteriota bacterium]